MKCLFFTGRFMMTCKADVNVYVPSSFEVQEYCASNRHKVCPLYCKARSMEERRLFLDGTPREETVLSSR